MFSNKKYAESSAKYSCINCNYITNKKSNYDKHLTTTKHKKSTEINENGYIDYKVAANFKCQFCSKSYKDRSGLWRHNKTCNVPISTDIVEKKLDPYEIIQHLLTDNAEFKKMLIEQNKYMTSLTNNLSVTNNNVTGHNVNNKTFNLNVFLNETCKDAMNIEDFVSSIKVDLDDLENTGEKGYVEGISNIFIKNLNNLEKHLRPLHCSDSKREVLYIKNNNEWVREKDDKPILTNAIKTIAHENIKQIKCWAQKYPEHKNYNSKKNETYLQIVSNSMNGLTAEESFTNVRKIISNISKEVVIDKQYYLIT